MSTALKHTASLSQHACAAATAIDRGDTAQAYADLLAAEDHLRAAKLILQLEDPAAVHTGAVLRCIACDHLTDPSDRSHRLRR